MADVLLKKDPKIEYGSRWQALPAFLYPSVDDEGLRRSEDPVWALAEIVMVSMIGSRTTHLDEGIHTFIYIFIYIQYEIWSISQRFFPIFSGDIRISLFSVLGANCKSRDWEYSLQCLGHMICDIQIWPWHRFISLWPVMERLAADDFVGLAPYDQWQGSWYVCLLLLFFAWEKGEGEGEE